MNVLDGLEDDLHDTWARLTRHHTNTQKNQHQPAQQEEPVIADLAKTIKDDIANVVGWSKSIAEDHVPALLDEVEKLQASPIVQALEGLALPPGDEQMIATLIGRLAAVRQAEAPVAVAGGDQAAVTEPEPASA